MQKPSCDTVVTNLSENHTYHILEMCTYIGALV